MNMQSSQLINTEALTLSVFSPHVVIVAYKEDTTPLNRSLQNEGFTVEEVRGPYTPQQLNYSAAMRCLVNHSNAWRIAATSSLPTIIVEADFVPVQGIGDLPVPLPSENLYSGISYLYACGPQVWDLATPSIARGHAGAMVALLIPPKVAQLLLDFFENEVQINFTGEYSPWDAKIGYWLKEKGIQSYIPYRNYGEHGGIGNPEHRKAGLGRQHQADALQGKLLFKPMYSNNNQLFYYKKRFRARIWGILRLLSGRLIAWHDLQRSGSLQILRFTIGRLLFSQPPIR